MNTPLSISCRKARGFTLLELVLSMTLTAMLLSLLSAGVYAVVNDWKDETSVLDESLDKALIMLQLERALQAAVAHSYIDEERLARMIYFHGAETGLSFVSVVSPQRAQGLTAWRLQSGSEGIFLSLTPAFSDNPDTRFETLEPQPLLPGYEASFRYLLQRGDDSKEWLDAWEGSEMQSLPVAVQIVLTPRERGGNEQTLEILTPIHAWRHDDIEPTLPVF